MDSFELNKIAGAVLATLMIVLGVSILAEEIFHAPAPEEPGYLIAVADDPDDPDEAAPDEPALGTLLAAADPSAGQSAVRPCAACHTFEQGGEQRVGPNLYNVVGGPKAHIDGFNYSSAMQEAAAAGEVWGYEELDGFLANPRGYMPGTTMAFAGVRDAETRADIIMYLAEQTEDPPPLPEAPAEAAETVPADEVDAAEPGPAEEDVAEGEAADEASELQGLIAAADPSDGEAAARPCLACHTFEEGGGDRVGPNLYNVVGGPKAHVEGFRYSDAMQEAAAEGEVWGHEELDAFLADPRGYMPGTTMAFAGVRDDARRAALIAYMRELTEDPPPLEAPEQEDAAEAAPAPAVEEPAPAEQDATEQPTPAEEEDAAEQPVPAEEDAAEAEEPAPTDEDVAETAPAAADAPEGEDSELHAMIAAADPSDGQAAARPCVACHTFEEGAANRVGPNLYNIVGAPKAHLEGFRYSAAMQGAAAEGAVWNYEELDAFLADPRGYMPGTTMVFAGVRDDERRAALIAYLRELTEDPPPLQGAE